MPTLVATLDRKDGILAGVGADHWLHRDAGVWSAVGLDGAMTGDSFAAPGAMLSAAAPQGSRYAFATEKELLVLDAAGRELWRTAIEASWPEGGDIAFDRSGETVWLTCGRHDQRALLVFTIGEPGHLVHSLSYSEHLWLLPDWSVDRTMLVAAYYDQVSLQATELCLRGAELTRTWSCDITGDDDELGCESVALHYQANGLVVYARGVFSLYRANDARKDVSARGLQVDYNFTCTAPDRFAACAKDGLRIYDASTLGQIALVPTRADHAKLLQGDRVLAIRRGPPSAIELWSV